MKHLNHSLLALLFVCLVAPSFAQDKDDEKSNDTKNSRTNGLRRITPARHWDIDDEAINVHVEKAVEQAMKSVEVAMEKMEINLRHLNIEPVEVRVPRIAIAPVDVQIPRIAIEPIEINIPPIDINIPPINVDVDRHIRHIHDWDDDSTHKRHRSDKDNEKAKGLKKIN